MFVLAASAAVAQAQTISLIEGYNTWSKTPGTDGLTSAELFFQRGNCGVLFDKPDLTITTAHVGDGNNFIQVSPGMTTTIDQIQLLDGVSSAVLKIGTENEENKDGYTGTLDVNFRFQPTKIGFIVNSGTLNIIDPNALQAMPFTVANKGVINLWNANKTAYATYNNGGTITVKSGGVFNAGSIVAPCVVIENGGTLTSTNGIRVIKNETVTSQIDGALVVTGYVSGTPKTGEDGVTYNTRNFAFRVGNGANAAGGADTDANVMAIIGKTGTIKQYNCGLASAVNDIHGQLTVNAAEGALQFQNTVTLSAKGKLILNSKNAFSTISKDGNTVLAGQAGTTFNVSKSYYENTAQPTSDSTLIVNVDNDLGALAFGNGTKLTLQIADGAVFSLGEIKLQTGHSLNDYILVLDNWHDNSFRITEMTAEEIEGLHLYGTDGEKLEFFAVDDQQGGYWINSQVPEPAAVAAIFGALALALAAYRRRK